MSTVGITPRALLERDEDLAEIDQALAGAAGGDGAVLLVEGPAGIGKTVLLAELRRRARARDMTVLAARGGELERGFGFGVVRQLLEATVTRPDAGRLLAGAAGLAAPVFAAEPAADVEGGEVTYATLHGLYWLVANLAERGPVVLAVDDAHWADAPSLRFLLHLAPRLDGLPVLVALTCRTGAPRPELGALLVQSRPVLEPRPLGAAAVARLVRAGLGGDATDALCRACHEATGGNPFLLVELLGELRRRGGADPAAVRGLAPERVAAAVLLRVGDLGPDGHALARAAAVLGVQARPLTCARLAGLPPLRARALADALAEVSVLEPGEPVRFVHPILRTAVYDDIPAGERARMHAVAARLLAAEGADPAAVAVHLLATDPAGDAGAVATLRQAAARALAGGAPDTAAALLRRALAEPPDPPDRPGVLFELGRAEHEYGAPAAIDHLLRAAETTTDPMLRAQALVTLAWAAHTDTGVQRRQVLRYERAAAEIRAHDRELALELEAARLGSLMFNVDLTPRFEDEADRFRDVPAGTAAECMLLSFVARRVLAAGDVDGAGRLAARAAAHPALASTAGHPLWRANVTLCLVAAERYDEAETVLTRAWRHAERTGSPQWLARAAFLRALVRHRHGDLRGAEADARAALDAPGLTSSFSMYAVLTPLIDALADQGRCAEGEALLAANGMDGALAPVLPAILPLIARGRLRAAAGDAAAARADLEDALRRIRAVRGLVAVRPEARVALVPVLLTLGDTDDARTVAAEAVADARSARAAGGALRVAGLATGGSAGLDLLRRAADTLAGSPSLLWRAEAQLDLGAALRRDGQRAKARPMLADALDLAHRCGAAPLADRAAEELRAAGARPRRLARGGAAALTASERRVAELAATGLSNKDIAQALFVTLRTVEMHLTNAYGKLAIRSRQELGRVLPG